MNILKHLLLKTDQTKNFPLIIFNTQYHQALIEHINLMRKEKTINDADLKLFMITDDIGIRCKKYMFIIILSNEMDH